MLTISTFLFSLFQFLFFHFYIHYYIIIYLFHLTLAKVQKKLELDEYF